MAVDERSDLEEALSRWQLGVAAVRERLNRVPTPRERERWHALWLALRGWSSGQVTTALGRDPHAMGTWLTVFRQDGPGALAFVQTGGSPRPDSGAAGGPQDGGTAPATGGRPRPRHLALDRCPPLRGGTLRNHARARQGPQRPAPTGICRQTPQEEPAHSRRRQAGGLRRRVRRLADAPTSGATHVFVDDAHFYAGVDLHGQWVLKGTPAVVDSTSPRYGEKACYDSAVCLETGEVEVMPLTGHSSAGTAVSFLQHLRAHHPTPLVVCWDNTPPMAVSPCGTTSARTPSACFRSACRPTTPLSTPTSTSGLGCADVIANTCSGTAATVRAHVDPYLRPTRDPHGRGQAALPHQVAAPGRRLRRGPCCHSRTQCCWKGCVDARRSHQGFTLGAVRCFAQVARTSWKCMALHDMEQCAKETNQHHDQGRYFSTSPKPHR